jgi:hypothetical protein
MICGAGNGIYIIPCSRKTELRQDYYALRKEVNDMATSTFDKNITLDETAAKRLAEILAQPAPPRPNLGEDFWEKNKKEVDEWLSQFKK